jgi:hypothetical protein
MPEQSNTFNTGVPMSNGIGGTIEQGSDTRSGGAARPSNTNTPAGNSSGVSNTPSPAPGAAPGTNNPGGAESQSNVEYVREAIDNYLGASALAFTFGNIVDIYINKKLGFDELEKQYLDAKDKATITPEEKEQIKENFKKQKEELKEYFTNGPGKDALKQKFDDLKATAFELKKSITDVPKEFAKMISEAAMPNVIGPVGPNPFSTVLKVFNGISRIKKILDSIFISLQTFISVSESLGISKTPQFEQFMGVIATPLRGLEALLASIKKKEEEHAEDLQLQGKIEEAKKGWSYPRHDNKIFNAEQVEELARGDDFKMFQFPLTEGNRKDLFKAAKKDDSANDTKRIKAYNAELILKYDNWLRWLIIELKKSQVAASGGGANTSNDAQLSGSTPLGTSEGAMGPSA